MKKFEVIRGWIMDLIDNEFIERRYAEIKPLEDKENEYTNGSVLWQMEDAFDGESGFAYDDLKLAFENSGVNKSKWKNIDISQLSEENKALAAAIIAETNA